MKAYTCIYWTGRRKTSLIWTTTEVHFVDDYYSFTHDLPFHRQTANRWPGLLVQKVNSWSRIMLIQAQAVTTNLAANTDLSDSMF